MHSNDRTSPSANAVRRPAASQHTDTATTGGVSRRNFMQAAAVVAPAAMAASLAAPAAARRTVRHLDRLLHEIKEARNEWDQAMANADNARVLDGAGALADAWDKESLRLCDLTWNLTGQALALAPETLDDLTRQIELFATHWQPIGDIELDSPCAAPMLQWSGHLRRLAGGAQS